MSDGCNSRRQWRTVAILVAVALGLSAWWAFRVNESRANVPLAEPVTPVEQIEFQVRKPDHVTSNFFGRVMTVQPQFFPLRDQPTVGVVLTFSDGRTIAFACRPSQFGSVASCIGADAKILTGERDGVRDWLVSIGP